MKMKLREACFGFLYPSSQEGKELVLKPFHYKSEEEKYYCTVCGVVERNDDGKDFPMEVACGDKIVDADEIIEPVMIRFECDQFYIELIEVTPSKTSSI